MATALTETGVLFPDSTTQTSAAVGVPTGGLMMWPTSSAPSGWLLCNGQAVSRSTYSTLFANIGTTFGAGDGSTTFNLPDYRDRMPVGAGTTYSANSKGGSKDAIVVSHSHTTTDSRISAVNARNWSQGPTSITVPSSGTSGYIRAGDPWGTYSGELAFTAIEESRTSSTSGASGTNANLPPYIGIYFIIKT